MLFQDPQADEKALWVQAKRGVLAILRVQPAQDLVESLMRPVSEEDESRWETIVAEMDNEPVNRRMPSTGGAESGYRLEDIRSYVYELLRVNVALTGLQTSVQGSQSTCHILPSRAGEAGEDHAKRWISRHPRCYCE